MSVNYVKLTNNKFDLLSFCLNVNFHKSQIDLTLSLIDLCLIELLFRFYHRKISNTIQYFYWTCIYSIEFVPLTFYIGRKKNQCCSKHQINWIIMAWKFSLKLNYHHCFLVATTVSLVLCPFSRNNRYCLFQNSK